MENLADESKSSIFGLPVLRGAPDMFPNVKHIQDMFKPMDSEGACRVITIWDIF
jgi:hypothetical protein